MGDRHHLKSLQLSTLLTTERYFWMKHTHSTQVTQMGVAIALPQMQSQRYSLSVKTDALHVWLSLQVTRSQCRSFLMRTLVCVDAFRASPIYLTIHRRNLEKLQNMLL